MTQTRASMQEVIDRLAAYVEGQRRYFATMRHHTEAHAKHLASKGNVHGVTLDQLGLDKIHNYPISHPGEALLKHVDDRYMDLESAIVFLQSKIGTGLVFDRPEALSPTGGDTVLTNRPELTATGYGNAYGLERDHRLFMVTDVTTNEKHLWMSQGDSLQIPEDLKDDTLYEWSCSDFAEDGSNSTWSEPERFLVPQYRIHTPTITLVDDDLNDARLAPMFESSAFSVPGGADTHKSTVWTVKDTFGSTVFTLTSTAPFLTEMAIPVGVLSSDTEYVLSVVYEGEERGYSAPGLLSFKTKVVRVQPPTVGLRSSLQATSLEPTIDVGPFNVVGDDSDTFEKLELQITNDAGQAVWTHEETGTDRTFLVDVLLDHSTDFELKVRYKGTANGWGAWTVVNFTTMEGGVRGVVTDAAESVYAEGMWSVDSDDTWVEVRGDRWRGRRFDQTLWAKRLTSNRLTIEAITWVATLNRFVVVVDLVQDHRYSVLTMTREGDWEHCLGVVEVPFGEVMKDPLIHGVVDRQVLFSWLSTTQSGKDRVIYAAYRVVTGDLLAWRLEPDEKTQQYRGAFTLMHGKYFGGFAQDFYDNADELVLHASGMWSYEPATGTLNTATQHWDPGADLTELLPKHLGLNVYKRSPDTQTFIVSSGDHAQEFNSDLVPLRRWSFEAVRDNGQTVDLSEPDDKITHLGNRVRNRRGVTMAVVSGGVAKLDEDHNPVEVKTLASPTETALFIPGVPGYNNYRFTVQLPDPAARLMYVEDAEYNTIDNGEALVFQNEYQWETVTVEKIHEPGRLLNRPVLLDHIPVMVNPYDVLPARIEDDTETDLYPWTALFPFFN